LGVGANGGGSDNFDIGRIRTFDVSWIVVAVAAIVAVVVVVVVVGSGDDGAIDTRTVFGLDVARAHSLTSSASCGSSIQSSAFITDNFFASSRSPFTLLLCFGHRP
jgi:hypothetical protein